MLFRELRMKKVQWILILKKEKKKIKLLNKYECLFLLNEFKKKVIDILILIKEI